MLGQEIEFKYRADKINVLRFMKFAKKHVTSNCVIINGHDHFYDNPSVPGTFCRHRIGDRTNQLTFKQKLQDSNNFVRIENNLDLSPKASVQDTARLLSGFGYEYNTTIGKSSFIFKTKEYTLVYYVCYDEDRDVAGRFIEIELDEHLPWPNTKAALKELKKIERKLKGLGIGPKQRIKKSLWEMYRKH